MAWSYGNIRWTVPFVSKNGTSCHVDIYMRGYSGSSVTTLYGAADPFEYDEDNDKDLLNHVIRYRTGYLRVIEEHYGDLSAIYPTLNTDRYVEFYYGNTLDFNGYIQAQMFEAPWSPGPREVELPVISPLGLAGGTDIDWTLYNPPRWVGIEALINSMLGLLGGEYSGYYFPKIISTYEPFVSYASVNSLTFCPFGGDYDKGNNLNGMYAPLTVERVLTNICTWLGLVLHDVPGYVIFQKLDYNGQYLKRRDTSSPLYTPSVTDLTGIATVASDDNLRSNVLPLSKIDVQFAGELEVPNMSFSRCRGYVRPCAVEDTEFCTNSPMIGDFEGEYTINTGIDDNGFLSEGNICLGAYGSGSLQEKIMYRPADSWQTSKKIATYKFFEWIGNAVTLTFRFKFGEGYESLDNPENQTIAVIVKAGDYYWSRQSNRWLSTSGMTGYSAVWTVGSTNPTCELGFGGNNNLTIGYPLVVEFYAINNKKKYVFAIDNVGLMNNSSAAASYLNTDNASVGYTIPGTPSLTDGLVDRGYSPSFMTLNKIWLDGSVITGEYENEIINAEPQYPYLLASQGRLQVDVKMPVQGNDSIYLNRMQVWGEYGYWKMIAYGFKPWDDTYRLTLHNSSSF